MPVAHFRDRMRRLRAARCNLLSLDEAIAGLREGDLPPRSVAVTFDDGFHDFRVRALPVLREFDVPVTNYVATFYARFRRPVFDPACAYLLWKQRARGVLPLADVTGERTVLPIRSGAERAGAWRRITAHAAHAGLDARGKDRLLARVAASLDLDYETWVTTRVLQQMDAAELRSLPRDLVDLQLHTHRHRMPAEESLLAREIAENRAHLAAMLDDDRPRRHFCYPSGEFDGTRMQWLARQGVHSAMTDVAALAGPDDHPLLLPRFVDTLLQPPEAFDAWVSGILPLLRGNRRSRALGARGEATPGADVERAVPATAVREGGGALRPARAAAAAAGAAREPSDPRESR